MSALPQDADVHQQPAELGIFGQDTIVGINQGWKLSGAVKTAERASWPTRPWYMVASA